MQERLRRGIARTRTRMVTLLGGPFALAFVPIITLGVYHLAGHTGMYLSAFLFPILIAYAAHYSDAPRRIEMPRDAQSGLPVKEALELWAVDAVRNGTPVVFSVMIDGLDTIEQRFGREMRHSLLKEAARRVSLQLRDDDMLVRMGPTGFAAALSHTSDVTTDTLLSFARRLQRLFDEPILDAAQRVYCSVSIGITPSNLVEDLSPAHLLEAAEETGEIALASGPGAVWLFRADRRALKPNKSDRAEELIAALETGQIVPFFQPQVTTGDGLVCGFEALARWAHPDRGLIPPAEFLPAIQRNGLSQRLTEVILKQSLASMRDWETHGFPIRTVSVNFSSEELRNPRLADYVRWELDQNGLSPDRLVVEVLESVIADRHEDVISRTLTDLSNAGCHVDLDDFGTGFTSIMNFQRFAVSRIKLDRCLVAGIEKDAGQEKMVRACLSLTASLDVETLAEGVETPAERKKLAELGCPLIQGFVVARPMAFEDTLSWLRQRRVLGPDDILPGFGAVAAPTTNGAITKQRI